MPRPQDVFTPGSFPALTYVERRSVPLESLVQDALNTPGAIVSLSGPSKSGKTVLVEKVVGRDSLITISGADVRGADDLWERVLDWMDIPDETTHEEGKTLERATGSNLGVVASLPGVGGVNAGLSSHRDSHQARSETRTRRRRGRQQVIDEIGNSAFVILIDDFHYMSREVQEAASNSLKEAARLGVKVCTATVRHRGDDMVRANADLRGRVVSVDIDYWQPAELEAIARVGFGLLKIAAEDAALARLALEAAGSPQLMQLICLNTCFELGLRGSEVKSTGLKLDPARLPTIFERTSASTNHRTLVDVLDDGPKTRGRERTRYQLPGGATGDVYRCVLRALAADPPRLSFPYSELVRRINELCVDGPPTGSSIAETCSQMHQIAHTRFPAERAVDWDPQKQILDVPDPYLLFYLRWSSHLSDERS